MNKPVLRALPLALSLALACGFASAADTAGSGTASTGSSVTGGQSAPAAQPATGTRNSNTKKNSQLARGDRKFMQDAAEDGMFEVQVGQLAANKASDDKVKQFASKLVEDHQSANNELVQLANTKGGELSAAPPRGKRRDLEKLGKDSGSKFDDKFVKAQVKDHEKDIKKFEKASGKVKDPQLKAWIDKTLPHLREHLAMAQQLPEAGKHKSDAASMGNSGASKSDMGTTPGGAATGTNTGKKTGS
jgi:putative membrane protein